MVFILGLFAIFNTLGEMKTLQFFKDACSCFYILGVAARFIFGRIFCLGKCFNEPLKYAKVRPRN